MRYKKKVFFNFIYVYTVYNILYNLYSKMRFNERFLIFSKMAAVKDAREDQSKSLKCAIFRK